MAFPKRYGETQEIKQGKHIVLALSNYTVILSAGQGGPNH